MNFTDLKYVIEIEKHGSFSMAAKKLFVAQSNLSRAVKELEQEYNITIFQRTPKGVITTREGQRFLNHAKEIHYQLDSLNNEYSGLSDNGVSLKLSVPRASYIAEAFADYTSLCPEEHLRMHYHETNSMSTIKNVLDFHYDIGIIRYHSLLEGYYLSLLKLKNLQHRLILEYDYLLLTSARSSIAGKHIRSYKDLEGCVEIVHGDKRLPSGDYVDLSDNDREERSQKKVIYIYERGSQFQLLDQIPNSFMWVSPIPEYFLKKYDLVQMRCGAFAKYMKDVQIYKENHIVKKHEKDFMDILREKVRDYGCYF